MIVKRTVLRCNAMRAFRLFTEEAGAWWPTERRHTDDPQSVIRIEASGRFFERANDGTEVELGVVRVYEPEKRLILDWYPGTGSDRPTYVEITFEAIDDGTRITIEHRPGVAGPTSFGRNAPAYDKAWNLVLSALTRSRPAPLDAS